MEELESLFGGLKLDYKEFAQKVDEAGIKLANLKSGGYVDKGKYEKLEKSELDWKTKFEALTESTKDYEQLKTNFETLTAEHTKLLEQQENDKKTNLVKEARVNPKFVEFVVDKVSKLTDDKKDFQTALSEYLKENSEFISANKGTFVNLETGTPAPKTENEKMNEFIRRKK